MTVAFPDDLTVGGNLRVNGVIQPPKARGDVLAISTQKKFPIPLTSFRVFDNMALLLPSAGATDDLGIVEGTHGTDTPALQTQDYTASGSAVIDYARFLVSLPWEYVAANAVTLRFMAGMIGNPGDQTPGATLDCSVFKQQDDPDDAIGSDLASAAVSDNMNSTTFANIDFTITAGGLSPGDILDVKVFTTIDHNAATECIGAISYAQLLCDVR